MASRIQYHEYSRWSCLPCIGDGHHPAGGTSFPGSSKRNTDSEHSEMKPTEEILASELNKLSVQERTEAFDDLHCVGEELKETPEIIEKSLAEFEQLVQKKRTPVYDLAWNQNRAYIEDPSLRLRFLRANLHNVDKSVRQMMNFLKHKANYFGRDKVAREITLDDLDEEDMRVLLAGLWHVQEGRDRSGRVIIHTFGNLIAHCKPDNLTRAGFYIFNNILLRDPAVQMKGMVTIMQNASRAGDNTVAKNPSIDFVMKVNDAASSFPVRYSAMHFCLQTNEGNVFFHNALLRPLLDSLPQYAKVRGRIHVGSSTELQYEMRSHGIPLDTYPIDMNGNVRENILNVWLTKYHHQMMQEYNNMNGTTTNGGSHQMHYNTTNNGNSGTSHQPNPATHTASWNQPQQQQQQQRDVTLVDVVSPPSNHMWSMPQEAMSSLPQEAQVPFVMAPSVTPTSNDVLLGRGKFAQSWAGNVKFREFIEKQFDEYNAIPTSQRNKRTIELTQELMSNGVRFFGQQDSGEWVEADCTEARQKVSQMFRSLRKKKSSAAQCQ